MIFRYEEYTESNLRVGEVV